VSGREEHVANVCGEDASFPGFGVPEPYADIWCMTGGTCVIGS